MVSRATMNGLVVKRQKEKKEKKENKTNKQSRHKMVRRTENDVATDVLLEATREMTRKEESRPTGQKVGITV